jgi:hypothetical protein
VRRLIPALVGLALLAVPVTVAQASAPRATDYAIIGDTPYGATMFNLFPGRIAQINADPKVRLVVHLGDIKNGSSRCDTSYFDAIRADFDAFSDPLVYTPGDNEWTDCHRTNNGGYQPAGPEVPGAPVITAGPSRLNEVRRIFFPIPGYTLGQHRRQVERQEDGPVENVRWNASGVSFGVLNVPGSNNDVLPWFGSAETDALKALQADEVATRTAADLRWLKEIFAEAREEHAKGVVLGIQADMWDPAITGDPKQYSGFTGFVQELAKQSLRFGGPVLLLNGDSHIYGSDTPLANPAATNNTIYGVASAVPNLTRVTIDGSGDANDYLRLHIDAGTPGVFSWERQNYLP